MLPGLNGPEEKADMTDPVFFKPVRRITVGEVSMDLSAREFGLAEQFLRHPDQVLSREQLLSRVWGFDFDPGSNVVDVYVGYLRRKLEMARDYPRESRIFANEVLQGATHIADALSGPLKDLVEKQNAEQGLMPLIEERTPVVVVDREPERVGRAREAGLQAIEGEIKHLPDRTTTHRMELAMSEINGKLNVMAERLKPIEAIGERLQETLMEQARK